MQLAENSVARRVNDARKFEALALYLTGEHTYASLAEELGISERTVSKWFASRDVLELVDEMLPIGPSLVQARTFAAERVERALGSIWDIAEGKVANARAADRLKASQFVLSLAGVRPVEASETPAQPEEPRRAAVAVQLHVTGIPEHYARDHDIVEGVPYRTDRLELPAP